MKLQYFAGMTVPEAAEAMGISRATADRNWAYAKIFLYCEMEDRCKNWKSFQGAEAILSEKSPLTWPSSLFLLI